MIGYVSKWDLIEKEDERMGVCLRRSQGGEKNRRERRKKEDRKGHETIVVVFFDTHPPLPG
jgi:hypothetical protein